MPLCSYSYIIFYTIVAVVTAMDYIVIPPTNRQKGKKKKYCKKSLNHTQNVFFVYEIE